jgi:hypothetical protein
MAPVENETLIDLLRSLVNATTALQNKVVELASLNRQFVNVMKDIAHEMTLARQDRQRIAAIETQLAGIVEGEREHERKRKLLEDAARDFANVDGDS